MCITLPFQKKGHCIDCGNPHNRDKIAWRCWSCTKKVVDFRNQFAKVLKKAIKDGYLVPVKTLKCVDCGATAEHRDHRDYRNIADVQPVCRSCNFKRGPAEWGGGYSHDASSIQPEQVPA